METTALIILLISLALAAGAAYWFIQWKCPTRLERLTQVCEETKSIIPEEGSNQANSFEPEQLIDFSPAEICQAKNKLIEIQKEGKKEIVKLQKAIKEEANEDEKTKKEKKLELTQAIIPQLAEALNILQP